ncbi:hypothetical protein B0T24DRAFT_598245 [Lasiosphaeria ovina]|uniref:Uncharacterized protein n=1 Tax=Lasiosphaeria ovina TaxID=92902 RepID=A0AAE0MZT4_9PEZI|nr:hypothetical protein B0T24DRAFT_598245 [Lasiosphaeria ovina]
MDAVGGDGYIPWTNEIELLPSSNSEASTSCACKVSWNRDNRPEHRFRAEIVFRSREDVAKELEATYKEIRDRNAYVEDEEDDDDNKMHQTAEMEAQISEGLKKISAVWGVKEEELKDMTAKSLLESNQDVLALLGTTKRLSSANADEFSEAVKPYIDVLDNTYGFKAWPLINEAKLFIIDEIDCDVFVKSKRPLKTDQALQEDNEEVKRLTTSLHPIETQIKTEQKNLAAMDLKLNNYDSELKALTPSGPGSQKPLYLFFFVEVERIGRLARLTRRVRGNQLVVHQAVHQRFLHNIVGFFVFVAERGWFWE